jgi:hypothetical protein
MLKIKTHLSLATLNYLVTQRNLTTSFYLTKDKTLCLKANAFKLKTNFKLILIIS